jgi:hypothetical protein
MITVDSPGIARSDEGMTENAQTDAQALPSATPASLLNGDAIKSRRVSLALSQEVAAEIARLPGGKAAWSRLEARPIVATTT